MKGLLYLVGAILAVMLGWGIVKFLIGLVLAPFIKLGMIILFCWLVFAVYKSMSRQKLVN